MNEIKIANDKYDFSAYFVRPKNSGLAPAIILIHEVWGLNQNIIDIAERFCAEGYVVLAPDLISQTGILEKVDQSIMTQIADPASRDEAQKRLREATAPLMSPEFGTQTIEKLQLCFDYLKQQQNIGRIAVLGFCFGGTYAYALAAVQPDLGAAVPFYGHFSIDSEKASAINCPILAFYGGKDQRLMQELPEVEKVMKDNNKNFEKVIYPDAGHAFFNETNATTYNKAAADDSWKKLLEFLAEYI
jgi:carboxymethylenebutenolidase